MATNRCETNDCESASSTLGDALPHKSGSPSVAGAATEQPTQGAGNADAQSTCTPVGGLEVAEPASAVEGAVQQAQGLPAVVEREEPEMPIRDQEGRGGGDEGGGSTLQYAVRVMKNWMRRRPGIVLGSLVLIPLAIGAAFQGFYFMGEQGAWGPTVVVTAEDWSGGKVSVQDIRYRCLHAVRDR